MDPTRFDDLTKVLVTATSRRQALKTIAATTIGGLLGLAGIGTAFAKRPNGGKCKNAHQCGSGNCTNGICCGSGQVGLCNGSCVTPCTSNANCSVGLCYFDIDQTHQYCTSTFGDGPCSSDCGTNGCPQGSFCGTTQNGGSMGFCEPAS